MQTTTIPQRDAMKDRKPSRKLLALWFVWGVVVVFLAWRLRVPGYMDADYYFTTASSLAQGQGFQEPYLWNYLDSPDGLPHPSHLYWMPLASMIAAASMNLFGMHFFTAQLPFILFTILLPAITWSIARDLYPTKMSAWPAALLAAIPGFYLPYLLTTDSFSLYAVVGALTLWGMSLAARQERWTLWAIVGFGVGLGNLTRADGMLMLLPAFVGLMLAPGKRLQGLAALFAGYALVMGGWWARNILLSGNPGGGGGLSNLWLTSYNELFSYPASRLSFERWLGSGLIEILLVRFQALGTNLQRMIAENGILLLGPFMLAGGWHLRKHRLVQLTGIYLLLLLLVMSFVFPFSGANGAFFHSGAAVMPVLWSLAPVGFKKAIAIGVRRRGWKSRQASTVFGVAGLFMLASITAGFYWMRVVGVDPDQARWESSFRTYERIGRVLAEQCEDPALVAVNNPPGFYAATHWPAVVIPDGDPSTLKAVVDRYQVAWVILDSNHPAGLADLYADPSQAAWLELQAELQLEEQAPVWLLHVVGMSRCDR